MIRFEKFGLTEAQVQALIDGTVTKSVAATAHGFVVGDVLRMDGTDYVKSQSDSEVDAEVVGMVAAVPNADNFTLATFGFVSGLSGLTAGATYFLDTTTAGALTETEPSAVGQVSKPVFIATTTTSGYFFNMRGALIEASNGGGGPQLLASVDIATDSAAGDYPIYTANTVGADVVITDIFLIPSGNSGSTFRFNFDRNGSDPLMLIDFVANDYPWTGNEQISVFRPAWNNAAFIDRMPAMFRRLNEGDVFNFLTVTPNTDNTTSVTVQVFGYKIDATTRQPL